MKKIMSEMLVYVLASEIRIMTWVNTCKTVIA